MYTYSTSTARKYGSILDTNNDYDDDAEPHDDFDLEQQRPCVSSGKGAVGKLKALKSSRHTGGKSVHSKFGNAPPSSS